MSAVKKFIVSIIVASVMLLAIATYDNWSFYRKFYRVLEGETHIEIVLERLGKPSVIFDREDFFDELRSNPKNDFGFRAYYWRDGLDSYYYIVTDKTGKIINYAYQG